ncbi:MAG TPA: twin-arginine translocase TatA/TatE family subunit, partial [Chthonomonadales bacterium]|nr:twin-arginine translocase TatA/TatE family subunit [Chthonomonadales bacterium]
RAGRRGGRTMFDGFGPAQVAIVLVIVLLLFGNRVPQVMRGLGSGLRQFRKGLDDDEKEPEPKTKR